jgi:hypothetical protein
VASDLAPAVAKEDRFPRAPRLGPLRAALAKLDQAAALKPQPPEAPQVGKRTPSR